jgi:hypothetical protein
MKLTKGVGVDRVIEVQKLDSSRSELSTEFCFCRWEEIRRSLSRLAPLKREAVST